MNETTKLQNRGLRRALCRENRTNGYDLHVNAHLLPVKLRQQIALMKIMGFFKEECKIHRQPSLVNKSAHGYSYKATDTRYPDLTVLLSRTV